MTLHLLDKLVGQELAKKIISQTLRKKGEIYNFLFFGPDGVGKRKTALLLAKSLLCPEGGCEICPVCQKIDFFTFHDFSLIVPITAQIRDEEIHEYTRQFANPNNTTRLEEKTTITIDQIRELQANLKFRPIGSQRRVVVILDVDRMNKYAANCFLKTLEEPPPGTVFILTASRLYSVMPTIRSRCQLVPFRYLRGNEIREILETAFGEIGQIPFDDFGLGSISETLLIAKSNYLTAALEIFKKSPLSTTSILKLVETYEKRSVLDLIYILLILYRTAILVKLGYTPTNRHIDIIRKKAESRDIERLFLSSHRLHDALFELSANPNKKLFLFSVLTALN